MSGKGLSIPRRQESTDPMRLEARPDTFRVRFAIRAIRKTAAEALQATRDTSVLISQKFQQELKAVTVFKGSNVTEVLVQKRVGGIAVTADGIMSIKLDPGLDFWARNALHIRTVDLTKQMASSTSASDGSLTLRFEAPEAIVLNPEAYRSELIKQWVTQVRSFADAAQSARTPLSVVDCQVPAAVQQSPVSVDEVELSLRIQCRLDIRGGAMPNRGED